MSLWTSSARLLSSRRSVAAAVFLALALPLGCTGLQFGNVDSGLVQEGEVTVQPNQEVDVYYSTPFASAPQLVTYWTDRCVVLEQTPTHFHVRNNGGSARKLAWKASGTAAMPAPQQPFRPTRAQPATTQGPPQNPSGQLSGPGPSQEAPPRPVTIGPPQ